MAILLIEGFDAYGAGVTGVNRMKETGRFSYDSIYSGAAIYGPGNGGGKCFRVAANGAYTATSAFKIPIADTGTFSVGFYARWNGGGAGRESQFGIGIVSGAGLVRAFCGGKSGNNATPAVGTTSGGSTLYEHSAPVFLTSQWQHLEYRFNASAKTISFKWEETLVYENVDLSAQFTGANANAAYILIGNGRGDATEGYEYLIDDLYLADNSGSVNNGWIGKKRVYTVMPASQSGGSAWGITGAASYAGATSEVPPDDDDSYLYSGTTNAAAGMKFGHIDGVAGTITAASVLSRVAASDGGNANFSAAIVTPAGTPSAPTHTPTPSYSYFESVYDRDAAGNAFTVSTLNDAIVSHVRKS